VQPLDATVFAAVAILLLGVAPWHVCCRPGAPRPNASSAQWLGDPSWYGPSCRDARRDE
jgi:hypothetical protein